MAKSTKKTNKTVEKYKKDFLKKVVARVDFAEPLGLGKDGPPDTVIEKLNSQFPIPELKISKQKHVLVGLDQELHETTSEVREWHYFSKSRHKRVQIVEGSVLIEYTKYNKYISLRTDFLKLVDSIFEAYPHCNVTRLGLRYIDHIELDEPHPTKWDKYLIKDLLTGLNLADDPRLISRSFHVLDILHDDESRLRFQYGMSNPDFPARVKRKFFVLDTDVFTTVLLEHSEIADRLDLFHTRAKNAFEQVITDELRKTMDVVYVK